jgi:hypothetical protein
LRLLEQEPILKAEWTDLFMYLIAYLKFKKKSIFLINIVKIPRDIHNLCLWDEKCIPKMKRELEADILKFIKSVQEVNNK